MSRCDQAAICGGGVGGDRGRDSLQSHRSVHLKKGEE